MQAEQQGAQLIGTILNRISTIDSSRRLHVGQLQSAQQAATSNWIVAVAREQFDVRELFVSQETNDKRKESVRVET